MLEPIEARVLLVAGALLLGGALLAAAFPRLIVYPLAVIGVWIAITLLYRAMRLRAPTAAAAVRRVHQHRDE